MNKPLKPWRSFPDQLARLESHGLITECKAAALDYLQRIGYYRLSGYWYPMRMTDKDRSTPKNPVRSSDFIPGSRFEDAVRLYVFDKKLRLLALDALERIEMALRVDIAHLLGELDPLAHENPSWLNPSCLHGNFTKQKIKKGKNKEKQSMMSGWKNITPCSGAHAMNSLSSIIRQNTATNYLSGLP